MSTKSLFSTLVFLCLGLVLQAQQPKEKNPAGQPIQNSSGPSMAAPAPKETDSVMVTIILKHQQDKNLMEIRRILEAQGFWDQFPPKDARVVSWTLAVGLGHIIVLQLPAGSIRRLNLAIENGAWGAFDTEIYISYDYQSIWQSYIEAREEAREEREEDKD
ncbi:MAG: hypothetical protein IT259_02320 [Saprospiraceae bacterium]|nr:hypothetical protein [Saprospiraceae bacterium]